VGWVALALLDATLLLISDTGRRMLPPLAMMAPISLMTAAPGGRLVALMANGGTRVWDVRTFKVCARMHARPMHEARSVNPRPVEPRQPLFLSSCSTRIARRTVAFRLCN
jgi:TUP1-like enhancer of split